MSGKSYNINHATNTAIIKDHSYRSCIKILALAGLTFFIITVLILCWLQLSNGIEPMLTTITTENYGVHDKVVQGKFEVPGVNNKRRLISTTPRPNFDKSQYKYLPGYDDAHLHGPNIDDRMAEIETGNDNNEEPETVTVLNNSSNVERIKMDKIRLEAVKESTEINKTTTTNQITTEVIERFKNIDDLMAEIEIDYDTTDEPDPVENSSRIIEVLKMDKIRLEFVKEAEDYIENTTTNLFTEITTSIPELTQKTTEVIEVVQLQVVAVLNSTTTIDNLITTNSSTKPELQLTTEILVTANKTTTEFNNLPETTTLPNILIANVQNFTTIPFPTCPSTTDVVITCPIPLPVCETLECKKSASKILSLLNHEVDPCDDFYAFTCSGSHLNKVALNSDIYEDDDIYGIDLQNLESNVQFIKKYKRFYDSCMNYDKDEELSLLQKHMKDIHTDNVTLTDKPSKLADLLADILKFGVYGTTSKTLPIINIVMDIGPHGKFIPVITIPTHKSPIMEAGNGDFYEKHCLKFTESKSKNIDTVESFHEIYDDCMQNYTLYETVLQKSIDKLQLFDHLAQYEAKQKASKVITVVMWDVIDEIGGISDVERIKFVAEYDPVYYSLADLQVYYPDINWQRFFNGVFNNAPFIFDNVKIMYPSYLLKIFKFYKARDYDEIESSILAMISHDFYIAYLDESELANAKDRKSFCTKLTVGSMKEVSTKILINNYSDEQIMFKEKLAEKIFVESKASFAESIENVTWLSTGEKEVFVNKLKDIKMIGKSTEFYKDPTILAQLYADIDIQDSLVHNTLAMKKFRQKFMYNLMSKDYLESQYFWTYLASPLDKSARTIMELDSIVVPFRLLSNSIPMTNKMKQKYEIYSKLSYHISYELASFFSPTNIRKFWTTRNEIYKNFAATNLIDPYITHILNIYELEMGKDAIKHTLNSRFNDDAAIRIALETYRWKSQNTDLPLPWLNLTIPQLFYVNFAQQFCKIEPNRVKVAIDTVQSDKLQNLFRLNSVIMNSKHFPDEFECNRGTNMNPSMKIEQFPHIFDLSSYDDITDNAT